MSDAPETYRTRVSGFWSPRHTLTDEEGKELGVLEVRRNRVGMVVGADYRPKAGEVLHFRREPGLLRGQFSLWTEGKEWLGSSIRPGVLRRTVELWTSTRPYRLVPRLGLGKGWRMVATKTGLVAEIAHPWFGRGATLTVHRKLDFELLLLGYFIGTLALWETVPPTALEAVDRTTPGPSSASPA
jgi:hypothetical protein